MNISSCSGMPSDLKSICRILNWRLPGLSYTLGRFDDRLGIHARKLDRHSGVGRLLARLGSRRTMPAQVRSFWATT